MCLPGTGMFHRRRRRRPALLGVGGAMLQCNDAYGRDPPMPTIVARACVVAGRNGRANHLYNASTHQNMIVITPKTN